MTVVTDEPLTVGDLTPKVVEGMVNAGHEDFTGPYDVGTRSGRASAIQDAIDFAENKSPELPFVLVPDSLGPGVSGYDGSAVNFSGSGGTWTGRMIRGGQLADVYDVKAYGAAGDGSTTDTSALQAALDGAGGSGIVHIPPSTYRVGQLTLPDGVQINMAQGASLEPVSGTTGFLLTAQGELTADRLVIHVQTGEVVSGLTANNVTDVDVDYLEVESDDIIDAQAAVIEVSDRVRFGFIRTKNLSTNVGAVRCTGSTHFRAEDADIETYNLGIWITDGPGGEFSEDIYIGPVQIHDGDTNVAEGTTGAVGIQCGPRYRRVRIVAPSVEGSREHGIRFAGNTSGVEDVELIAPLVRNAVASGIKILPNSGVKLKRVQVVSPTVVNADAGSLVGNQSGIMLHRVDDLQVVNPKVVNTDGSPPEFGIWLSAVSRAGITNPQVGVVGSRGVIVDDNRTDAGVDHLTVLGGSVEQTGDGTTGVAYLVDPGDVAMSDIRLLDVVSMDSRDSVSVLAAGTGSLANVELRFEAENPEVTALLLDSSHSGEVRIDAKGPFTDRACRNGSRWYDPATDQEHRRFNGRWITQGDYSPTNVATDRAYDADATTVDELADVLGTLLSDLGLS